MPWSAIAAGVVALGVLLTWWILKGPIRRGTEVEVVFDLRMPSKWAAELTGRVLGNDGFRSDLVQDGVEWICRVTRPMHFHPAQVEKLCARLDQVAVGRGGSCVAHTVRAGRRVRAFAH